MNEDLHLTDLKFGQSAVVSALAAEGAIRRRLQDMGLIEGTKIECVGTSPLGDPSAYLVRGAVVALRKKDAALVAIEYAQQPCACKAVVASACRAATE